jgi:enolase
VGIIAVMSIEAGNVIKSIRAREILDSRGNPTVEAEVRTSSGIKANLFATTSRNS